MSLVRIQPRPPTLIIRNTGVPLDFDALDNLDFGAAEEAIEELKKKQDEEAIVPGAGDNDCSSGACAI